MTDPGLSSLSSEASDLFSRLRQHEGREVLVRFSVGAHQGMRVEIPSTRTLVQGRLEVHPRVDRFRVWIDGWGTGDFAWFARRKGRGGPGYWQGAIEYRPQGKPALVHYFTAALDGLELQVLPATGTANGSRCEEG